jgi:alkanesulfonate monooxygenase SsuD/methylene tetrahydromethanopterin reductase-like flavin-dependent oxidoreductase (luciferase family)
VAAEELGFGGFYYGESPNGLNLETWTVLAGVAAHTSSIRIGPVITNLLPEYRSFPLLMRQVHALAVMSEGRLDLRTGTGAADRWAVPWWTPVGIDYPDRAERRAVLDEWLAAFHHVWSGAAGGFQGERLHFDSIPLEPWVSRPPVTVAATGPKAMMLAAARADVWEASHLDAGEFRVLARGFEAMCGERDRRMMKSLEVDVVTAGSQRERTRLEQSFLAERGPGGPAALDLALTGTADLMAERLSAYVDAGVDQFVAACVDPHDAGSLAVLAEAGRRVSARSGSQPGIDRRPPAAP